MDGLTQKQLYDKKYYQTNKGSMSSPGKLLQNKEWRKNNVNRTLYTSAKNRAKRKGLDFNIEIIDINIPEVCPILKVKLEPNQDETKRHGQTSPTLDRIDPTKGYVKGNIQVISYLANVMKNNATPEQLILFSNWIKTTYGH